jgi:hypothetical protein
LQVDASENPCAQGSTGKTGWSAQRPATARPATLRIDHPQRMHRL